MASAPDGGKIVSVRDSEGKIQVRIEYEREQVYLLFYFKHLYEAFRF